MNNSRIFLIVCIVLTLTLSACRLSASTPPPVTPTTNLSEIAKQATMTAVAKTPQTEGSETPQATSPAQEGTETAGETEMAPTNTPEPTDQPTSEPQQASTYAVPSSYTLHKGEWVYCLARRYDIHPVDLLNYNGLSKGAVLFPGETIQIPSQARAFPGKRALQYHPTTYTVTMSNNTTYSIACEFGDVDPRAIAEVNDIGVDQKLSVGQTIQIP
ncbi:MAG: LysM peptidoglycan-binding domain-containing protein [Anaerolineales bacterium]